MTAGPRFKIAVVVAAAALLAGCSSGSGSSASTTTVVGAGANTESGNVKEVKWEKVLAPRPCACSDGSEFHFWIRRANPKKVLFFLYGGGACFSKETCATKPTFTANLSDDSSPTDGIFDFSNPENPFADYSVVAVPYCTGDLHLGTVIHDYGDGTLMRHVGAVNGMAAFTSTASMFPDATEVVVAGSSAGAAGSPLYAGLASDLFPKANIVNIADAAGGYPANPGVTLAIGSLWGINSTIPAWPNAPEPGTPEWSLPGMAVQASKHDPEITFVRIDHAADEVQEQFNELAGLTDEPLINAISANEQMIRDSGAKMNVWINSGTEHTILGEGFYDAKIANEKLTVWLGGIVEGKKVDDERCDECSPVTN